MHRNQQGFTLIELLIVIGIIAALIATATLGIGMAQKRQRKMVTQTRLNNLAAWLEMVKQPDNLGAYPATDTSLLVGPGQKPEKVGPKVGRPNELNVGIETLYVAMHLKGLSGGAELGGEDALQNTDEDVINELVGDLAKKDLYEVVDSWGNPLIYFHSRDYKDPKGMNQYVLNSGDGSGPRPVTVEPRKSEKTGQFSRPDSFQLFSAGEDGIPGNEDDMHFGDF